MSPNSGGLQETLGYQVCNVYFSSKNNSPSKLTTRIKFSTAYLYCNVLTAITILQKLSKMEVKNIFFLCFANVESFLDKGVISENFV